MSVKKIEFLSSISYVCSDDTTFGYQYYGGTWEDRIKAGTAHISVVGPDGDAVSLTSTVNQ